MSPSMDTTSSAAVDDDAAVANACKFLQEQTHVVISGYQRLQQDLRAEQHTTKTLFEELRKHEGNEREHEEEIAKLKRRYSDLEREKKAGEAAHNKTMDILRTTNEKKVDAERHLNQLQESFDKMFSQNKKIVSQHEESQRQLANLRNDLRREHERVNELNDDAKRFRETIADLQRDNKKLEEDNEMIGKEFTKHHEHFSSLRVAKEEVDKKLKEALNEIDTLQNSNADIRSELENKSTQLNNSIRNYNCLNSKRNDDQNEIEALKEKNREDQNKIEALEKRIIEDQTKTEALKKKTTADHENEIETVKQEMAELESRLISDVADLKKEHHFEVEHANAEISSLGSNIDTLHNYVDQLQARVNTHDAEDTEMAEIIQQLHHQLTGKRARMNRFPFPSLDDIANAPKRLEQAPSTLSGTPPSTNSCSRLDSSQTRTTPKRPSTTKRSANDPTKECDPSKRRRLEDRDQSMPNQLDLHQPPKSKQPTTPTTNATPPRPMSPLSWEKFTTEPATARSTDASPTRGPSTSTSTSTNSNKDSISKSKSKPDVTSKSDGSDSNPTDQSDSITVANRKSQGTSIATSHPVRQREKSRKRVRSGSSGSMAMATASTSITTTNNKTTTAISSNVLKGPGHVKTIVRKPARMFADRIREKNKGVDFSSPTMDQGEEEDAMSAPV